MDRSFLSDAQIVMASRQFVCIRLATYEDQAEAEFMKSLYIGRSGELENTTFSVLSPDGKRKLSAAGRGPNQVYRRPSRMVESMNQIAARFPNAAKTTFTDAKLPFMKSVDVALNVAAADGLPLIVIFAESKDLHHQMEERLLPIAWSESLAGQFIYAVARETSVLKPITGFQNSANIMVIEPGQFGLTGQVLSQFPAAADGAIIRKGLQEIVRRFPRRTKDHDAHVRWGIELGIDWESAIPETDPMSIRARERARRGR